MESKDAAPSMKQTVFPTPREDATQETGDIKRLLEAGERNEDPETIAAGVRRAARLSNQIGFDHEGKRAFDITNPIISKIIGLDKLTK